MCVSSVGYRRGGPLIREIFQRFHILPGFVKPLVRRETHVILEVSLWLMLAIIASLPNAPVAYSELGRDQGVFLYIGKGILSGLVPYRDIWDHKPPLIYFINAFGLWMARGSRWGVWLIEVLALYLSALISLTVTRRVFGDKSAHMGTALWILSLPLVLRGGNLPEEFGIFLQLLALLLFQRAENREKTWPYAALGAITATAFLLKQTLIGIGISVLLYEWLSSMSKWGQRAAFVRSLSMVSGGVIVLITAGLYFAGHGALGALWDCVFLYNLTYARVPTAQTLSGMFLKALGLFAPSGILLGGMAGWLVGLYSVWHPTEGKKVVPSVLKIALLDLPIEMAITWWSADELYAHYYIPWLPSLGILLAFSLFFLTRHTDAHRREKALSIWTWVLRGLPVWLLVGLIGFRLVQIGRQTYRAFQISTENDAVIEYIVRATSRDDFVLMWGAKVAYNFLADRPSPSRYAYQYPLYQKGYQNAEKVREFLHEIISKKPKLIIDTSTSSPSIPPIDPKRRAKWIPPTQRGFALLPEMDEVFVYLATHYQRIGSVGPNKWDVYIYAGNE